MTETILSTAPNGEQFTLPTQPDEAADPDLAEGKTGATPYFPFLKIGSCTGFSGQQDGI